MLNNIATKLLHLLPPERAHDIALWALERGLVLPQRINRDPRLAVDVAGLRFAHPLGLAAGFDKDARALRGTAKLGFSFIETGTITPNPQAGNSKPRLFRLKQDGALINRMGFNNDGSVAADERLRAQRGERRSQVFRYGDSVIPIGVNIGKNKTSQSWEATLADYENGMRNLGPLADYLVLNLSSPNTPGLRDLQREKEFGGLLEFIAYVRSTTELPPIFIKLAPDLEIDQVCGLCAQILEADLAGVILANTTISRDGLRSDRRLCSEAGGLSGKPLAARALTLTREALRATQGNLPIIASGGIWDGESAIARIKAGASLLQIYSALVLRGPRVIREITDALVAWMQAEGAKCLDELRGYGR